MVKMMSILKKIKLALLASTVMLSPQSAFAMPSGSDDLEESTTSRSHPNPPGALFKDGEAIVLASSSGVADPETQKTTVIPKRVLDDISAKLSPIGAIIKTFEPPEISPQSPQSPRKKEKPKGEMGVRDSFEISSPSTTMETKTPQNFEESLPALLLKFSERFQKLRNGSVKDKLAFRELYKSFTDVVKIYQNYHPDFQIVPDGMQRRHHIKRRHTMNNLSVGYKLTNNGDNGDNGDKKLTRTAQGDLLTLSLQDSLLFQRRYASSSSEVGSSSSSSSPPSSSSSSSSSLSFSSSFQSPPALPSVSPRLMHGVSLPSLPLSLPSPRPSEKSVSSPRLSPQLPQFSGKRELPPPVPHRLRSDLRPLPPHPRNVVSSSSRPLPQLPQSSSRESVPPPPVAPRHRSLSLSPKATFSGLSSAGFSVRDR